MPHYYFNVHNDLFTEDFEGAELSGLDAARTHAVESARSLAAETVMEGHLETQHSIEILDADRRLLAQVLFGDAIDVR